MEKDLHFFTIGAGALLNSSSSIAQVLGISQIRNSCYQGNGLKFLQNSLVGCYQWSASSGSDRSWSTGSPFRGNVPEQISSRHKLKCIIEVHRSSARLLSNDKKKIRQTNLRIVISFGHLSKWLVAMDILRRPRTVSPLNLLNLRTIVSFIKQFWCLENKSSFER